MTIFFDMAIKNNKAFKNKFKEVKDFYYENYKTLMKEIQEDTNKWKGRINC